MKRWQDPTTLNKPIQSAATVQGLPCAPFFFNILSNVSSPKT